MGHIVTAIIAKAVVTRRILENQPTWISVELRDDYLLIPVEEAEFDSLGVDFSTTAEGFVYLSPALEAWLAGHATAGPLVYLETDYHGGAGGQAAAAYLPDGTVTRSHTQEAINEALRLIGVRKDRTSRDEFEFIGLQRHRLTSDWKQVELSAESSKPLGRSQDETPASSPAMAVAPETLAAVVEILGTEGFEDEEIEARVRALEPDTVTARRLIDWIPEAFGMALVRHRHPGVTLLDCFFVRPREGKPWRLKLDVEPIYLPATEIARRMIADGPEEKFLCIFSRSSFASTLMQAANSGATLDGAVMTGPVLFGIPAETYPAPRKSFLEKWIDAWVKRKKK